MVSRLASCLGAALLFALAAPACTSVESPVGATGDAVTGGAVSGTLTAGARLVTTANVNFRSAPQISDDVLDVIPDGTTVTAVGGAIDAGFYGVTYEGATGYVYAQYLAFASAAPRPPPPSSVTDAGADAGGPDAAPPSTFTVTYIGDSHSDYYGNARGAFGFLGQHLGELMAAQGTPFALYAASGSSPTWWLDGTAVQAATWGYTQTSSSPPERTCSRGSLSGTCVPKLSAILTDSPSLFVIEQGTNLLGLGSSAITNEIQTLLAQIKGKAGACLWVGAPNAATSVHSQSSQDELWQLIAANAAPTCYVYDSRYLPETDASGHPILDAQGHLIMDVPLPYSPDANDDGEHLGMTAAGKWAQGVAQMIDFIAGQ